jgi:tetratricopeptide (TPR) repeat protein
VTLGIVLFNTAVAYHFQGLIYEEEGKSNHEMLARAQSFYLKTKAIFREFELSSHHYGHHQLNSRKIIDFITMVTLNNTAQILYSNDLYDESKTCFDQLFTYTETVPLLTYDTSTACILEYLKELFLSHALILKKPTAARAA